MRKLILLAAILAMVLVAAPAMAQGSEEFSQTGIESGKATPSFAVEQSPGAATPAPAVAAAPPPAPAPAPAPPPASAPAPAKVALPPTGGLDIVPLLGISAGVLLVSGGLLAYKMIR